MLTQKYDTLNAYEYEIVSSRQRDSRYRDEQQSSFQPQPEAAAEASNQSIQDSIPIKTRGGSIYNSLEHALFALGLLSRQLLPCIILITDGVATESGFVFNLLSSSRTSLNAEKEWCRLMSRQYVMFSIILVGSRNGFYPVSEEWYNWPRV